MLTRVDIPGEETASCGRGEKLTGRGKEEGRRSGWIIGAWLGREVIADQEEEEGREGGRLRTCRVLLQICYIQYPWPIFNYSQYCILSLVSPVSNLHSAMKQLTRRHPVSSYTGGMAKKIFSDSPPDGGAASSGSLVPTTRDSTNGGVRATVAD